MEVASSSSAHSLVLCTAAHWLRTPFGPGALGLPDEWVLHVVVAEFANVAATTLYRLAFGCFNHAVRMINDVIGVNFNWKSCLLQKFAVLSPSASCVDKGHSVHCAKCTVCTAQSV